MDRTKLLVQKVNKKTNELDLVLPKNKKQKWNFNQVQLQAFVWIGLIFIFIFAYAPMFGVVLAFKEDNGELNILTALFYNDWVGFDNFKTFFQDLDFKDVMVNTLVLNTLQLLINFPAPIIFAILLCELTSKHFKKFLQTITYFPYFLSWFVFGGIILVLLSSDGVVNNILVGIGAVKEPVVFAEAQYFWGTIIITSLLKGLGWGSIIYVAAISGIDPQLYEAARMDGANRWFRITKITIPMIAPTITLFFILSISGILNNGFDHIWVFQNVLNLERSEVLDTFIYKAGILDRRYAYTTAIGIFKSLVGIFLLSIGNFISKKITGNGVI